MKKITLITIIIYLVPVIALAELADTPWPMFRGNLLHTGLSNFSGTTVNTVKWKFKTNDNINSSPVIGADGTIYVGSDDTRLYAITPYGVKKWKYKTGSRVISTPAISSDGTIYVGSYDNKVYAINPDGTLKWKSKTNGRVESSPAIGSDGTIYVGSNDGYVYAFNQDGTKKWKFNTNAGSIFSSPAVGTDGTIYVGSRNGILYSLNPYDGTKKWKYETNGQCYSSPSIAEDGTIYLGASDGYLYAVNPDDGTKKWKFKIGGNIYSSAAVGSDGTIYVGSSNGNLYALNPDGTKKWVFKKDYRFDSSPAVDANGIIYVGCNDGKIYALNPVGTKLWHYNTGSEKKIFSSPAIGSDGTVYVGVKQRLFAIGTSSEPQAKTLTLPSASGNPGQTVNVPVNINNASSIESGEITITFNPDILTAGDAQKTDLSSQLSLKSKITAGQIKITLTSSSPLSGGSGELFTIPFTVDNDATGTSPLTFTEAKLKDSKGNELDVTTTNGTFTVQVEEEIVVSIPDVSGHPGDTVNANIEINDATGILAGDFTVAYDHSKVTAGSASLTTLTSNFFIVSSISDGEIKISIASSSPITSGTGALVSIPFAIGAEAEGSSPLSFTEASIYNQEYQQLTITTQDGSLITLPLCTKGDVNKDGVISSEDAELVNQISVGLIQPDDYQKCAGDVNGDGEINALDAALILQCVEGNCQFVS